MNRSAYAKTILYDPESGIDYQSLESGTLLSLRYGTGEIFLETHQEVWSPSRFTSAMCELIGAVDCSGKVVVDVAAGSGVLGIAAAKQGAKHVVMTDLNPRAMEVSARNWQHNQLEVGRLQVIHSNCLDRVVDHPDLHGRVDWIFSNPPTFPDTRASLDSRLDGVRHRSAADWNVNGKRGRLVTDALITEGRQLLAVGGEMLFVTTSKQGARLTCDLLERCWGEGVHKTEPDPLDWAVAWEERGQANWAVVQRLDLPLAPYYREFLGLYRELAEREGEPDPIVEREGNLYQKLYFIRCQRPDEHI